MKTAFAWLLALAPSLVPACGWAPCDEATVDFELAAPGDGVEIVIQACVSPLRGDLDFSVEFTPSERPEGVFVVLVDDLELEVTEDGGWSYSTPFSAATTQASCETGRRFTIRRVDAEPNITLVGAVTVELATSPRRTCSASVSSTPL